MIAAVLVIALGWIARLVIGPEAAHLTWMWGLALVAIPVVWEMVRAARRGNFATDIVAMLAVLGALALGTPLAGLVVVVMLRGGAALERYAEGRASAAVEELEAAAPRVAHRLEGGRAPRKLGVNSGREGESGGTEVEDIAAADVVVDDVLLIRPGELIRCDGVVIEGSSDVDTSTLTGEPLPVAAGPGVRVMSGSLNGAGVLRIRATARAAESQYARIVDLVRTAQSHKAPLQRMADRYAVWFTPFTLAVCVITFVVTREWMRVLAVLVVATPCPLILATPVAFVGGINRAARRHIVIRNGAALETLSRVTAVLLDKTGTITLGEPQLSQVRTLNGLDADELLRLAASVELGSSHRIARTVVGAARARGLGLSPASAQLEEAGNGVSAVVAGRTVRLGSRGYVVPAVEVTPEALAALESGPALLRTYVAVDGRLAGTFEYDEQLRSDARGLVERLRRAGVRKVALLSGDRLENVRAMAAQAAIDDVRGELLPEDKAIIVGELKRAGEVVMMVGDGTNDAPALAAADVGVALAGHGGGVTAEAADVILLRDSLQSATDAMAIGRDTTRIAKQSIWVGLGLSGAAMFWAAAGRISPVAGALLQEAIDVAVIVNALRTIGWRKT
jgi:heavy metal translocating P-type ATPase